jgi:hypothetical protein
MGFDFDNRYECRSYTSEYLYRDESVILRASRLFSAGEAETAFPVDVMDQSPISTALIIVIRPLLNLFLKPTIIGDRNPYVPYYRSPSDERNKLVVFKKWLVRCTYQQYNAKLGRVNTTECFNDQSEVDEGNKHHIKFLEAREDTPESLQSSEQSLNLVTPPIHSFVVFPRLNPIGFGRYYRDEAKLQHQLPRFVPFVGSIHQQMNWPAGLAQAAE